MTPAGGRDAAAGAPIGARRRVAGAGRSLGFAVSYWLLASTAAVLAARWGAPAGLATAGAAGIAFGLISARRVDGRRRSRRSPAA